MFRYLYSVFLNTEVFTFFNRQTVGKSCTPILDLQASRLLTSIMGETRC